ncbi:DUF427 domain-containing protein [Mangrovivirga cuniculi]|uniref:DUF427 domain-containing protein n=1 Tax=Mangrovivirga cuniculi TaxID=2715131 RepID=A0A4D7JSA2_9BACT|nr:DUF427 domain-containing protein [Mangrovivirga cuniculi]QCK15562.1 hypothetical protein DCC35_12795 [Mangrovivirga cuniculi]
MKKPNPEKTGKGQESVWDYPRPPLLERTSKLIEVWFNNECIARSNKCYRVLETSHPPQFYIPPSDVNKKFLLDSDLETHCEWKGKGRYYDLKAGGKWSENAAWYYDDPTKEFEEIKNYLAFYAGRVDQCLVDKEVVVPQPGGFYGGWITDDVVGPFKGVDGSWGW